MALNTRQCAPRLDPSKKQFLLRHRPHTSSSEVEVRHNTAHEYLADEEPLTIPDVDPIPAARVHIPLIITLDPIRHTTGTIREELSVRQPRPAIHNIKLVNRARQPWVQREILPIPRRAVRLHRARVGHVQLLVVRTEAEAVALHEAVRDAPDLARRRLEAVDLARQLGRLPEGLLVAVRRVREPDVVVGVVDHDVVDAVEGAAVEVVYEARGG